MRTPALLLALGLLLALAPAAGAATVQRDAGGSLIYTGAGTEANHLTVTDNGTELVFTDTVPVTPGAGCVANGANSARCTKTSSPTVLVSLGDGADSTDASVVTAAFTITGGAGSDTLTGSAGADVLDGGAGDDVLRADPGGDTISGGDGYDRYEPQVSLYTAPGTAAEAVVTLDDTRNDGQSGEGDDVRADVEDLTAVNAGSAGPARLTGDGDVNFLTGSSGADTLDGGPGGDVLNGSDGDDTLAARDGFADRVECGAGSDTATVDELDSVQNCETVNRAALPPAPLPVADRPPTAAFVSPADNTLVRGSVGIAVDATDDRGIKRVVLVDDGQIVDADTTAPYTFRYRPRGGDVGRNTLLALAVDSSDQTGSATRTVRVDRFLPRVNVRLTPSRDRTAPFRYKVSGTIVPPPDVAAAAACTPGRVLVRVRARGRTVVKRRATVRATCRWATSVQLGANQLGARISLVARFQGNGTLRPRNARTLRPRAG